METTASLETKKQLKMIPEEFAEFLQKNQVNPVEYDKILAEGGSWDNDRQSRFIRIKGTAQVSLASLRNELGTSFVLESGLIPSVFSIPRSVKIQDKPLYQNGLLYGLELSSALAVKALDPKKGERVLDLCCCPGAKLLYIADLMTSSVGSSPKEKETEGPNGKEEGDASDPAHKGDKGEMTGIIHGVDINPSRLAICRSLLAKYGHGKIVKVFCADGTEFSPPKELNPSGLYDKVIADVECTHEASLKHVFKFFSGRNESTKSIIKEKDGEKETSCFGSPEKKGKAKRGGSEAKKLSKNEIKRREKQRKMNEASKGPKYFQKYSKKNQWDLSDFIERVLDPKKLELLPGLQKGLLMRALQLVVPDKGEVIYSTCSLSKNQNESVVLAAKSEFEANSKGKYEVRFLDPFHEEFLAKMKGVRKTEIKAVYLDPLVFGGGLFIAKLGVFSLN